MTTWGKPKSRAALAMAAALTAECFGAAPDMSGASEPDSPSKSRKLIVNPSTSERQGKKFTLNVVDAD